ncbi:MAG TPA: phage portal protein [Propionibacteriaceae bacterium]|nr:phage portal protein [Propionibacteriaceae bacterium]
MSIFADLVDCYAATTSMPGGDGGPPVPYVADSAHWSSVGSLWWGEDRKQQLDLSTAESTLFSVLQLVSGETAAVQWYGEREQARPTPEQEPPRVTEKDSLAVKLWQQPNRWWSGQKLRTLCTWHYRAVGETWLVVDYFAGAAGKPAAPGSLPRGLWPMRPDRVWPIPDKDEYLVGYIYVGPSGERVPLEPHEVLGFQFPHPTDMHRGIGAVQTLGKTLGISISSAEWIAKFFQNDASPGGIIEIPEGLEDADYNRLRKRWNEQHAGVSKAHRIAILEYGKFVPRGFNMRDMQFREIRDLTRDQVLEAFRIHKHKMGISETVNLAEAFAAGNTFAKSELVPNLNQWAELANGAYRSLFGAPGESVRLCYESPVEEDKADERADRTARIEDANRLLAMGVPAEEAFRFVGMPVLTIVRPEPASDDDEKGEPDADKSTSETSAAGDLDETQKGDPLAVAVIAQKLAPSIKGGVLLTPVEGRTLLVEAGGTIEPEAWEDPDPAPALEPLSPGLAPGGGSVGETDPGNSLDPPADDQVGGDPGPEASTRIPVSGPVAAVAEIDLTQMGEDWQNALDAVLAKWPGILDKQYSALADQVRNAIDSGDLQALLELAAPDGGASEALTAAMVAAAWTGAAAVQREAADQGVSAPKTAPDQSVLAAQADVVTGLMRQQLAVSAGREALRVQTAESSGSDVALAVRQHLDSLTDAQPRESLGGALTSAQHQGRVATMQAAPAPAYYVASEQLDSATCAPCRRVNGRRYDTLAETKEDYPEAGYVRCLGSSRCRGTIVAMWDTEDGDDE